MSKRTPTYLTFATAALASVVALVSFAAGCSDGTTTDDSCFDYASFNATAPAVSFQTDVLPIFRNSCGLSAACHGVEAGAPGQPYLGPPLADGAATQAQISAILTQIVGVDSTKAPAAKIVMANTPAKSFLMHKMDNTLTCAELTCGASGCGASMPLAGPMLSETDRDTVRRWIAQGAKND